jgi:hypothetical protein
MKAPYQPPRPHPDDLAMIAFWIVVAGMFSIVPLVTSAELGHFTAAERMGEAVTWKGD